VSLNNIEFAIYGRFLMQLTVGKVNDSKFFGYFINGTAIGIDIGSTNTKQVIAKQ
jgi:activator of 2-hydroxyglutaryl-CoA dehydratase